MAARTLQPSEYEIQREVEALRDIRRRSITPGALTIDPDLPNQTSAPSPTGRTRSSGSATSPRRSHSNSSSSSYDRSSSDRSSHGSPSVENESAEAATTTTTDDPFHFFWVPASVHPEIAPAEFRTFLKEHARAIPPADGAELGRSVSSSSTSSLGRRRSMLRRQYQPHENDGVEEEKVVPLRRNRSYLYNPVPQLTFDDVQKLEQLAKEASESADSTKLRTMLRRSLSFNLSPSDIDRMDSVPEMGDEADAPIIVPPPGQILRRAARTKIRKPGLPGDGGGHRFGSTRGTRAATLPPTTDQRKSSDFSSSDHGDISIETDLAQQRRQTFSDDGFASQRPESFSEEASIFDAYARDDDEDPFLHNPLVVSSSPPPSTDSTDLPPSQEQPQLPLPEVQPALLDALGPILHQPKPQRLLSPHTSLENQPSSRTPSPSVEGATQADQTEIQASSPYSSSAQQEQTAPTIQQQPTQQAPPDQYPPQVYQQAPPVPQQPQKRERDKKGGLFGKWGGDKSSKKAKDREGRERQEKPEKEKDSSFFGSLFGGSKKKQDLDSTPSIVGGNAGREAAQALLGASKSSKNYVPPSSPGLASGVNPYARYPIHVERAIYRLSHIKLANPRRPLYEQVLISNLMFWYLGVINKAQNPTPVAETQPNGVTGAGTDNPEEGAQQGSEDTEREQMEREQREQEQREKAEKERLERERLEKEREMEMKKKESGKRGSLTKTPAGGSGARRAEMPIKGPQYEMQHRVMEQEYGNYNMQSNQQMGRGLPNGIPGQPYPRQQSQQYPNSPPKISSPQPIHTSEQQYYDGQQHPQRLPPGAMPPMDQTGAWRSQNNHQTPRNPSPQRSRTPPQNHINPPPMQRQTPPLPQDGYAGVGVGGGRPARSLSANAVSVSQSNNPKLRKGTSAHALPSNSYSPARRPRSSEGQLELDFDGTGGEEEDTPLATLRQQQRRVM